MERLDLRAIDRISGPSWKSLRPSFEKIHETLIGVGPEVNGELTTIYIKYPVSKTNSNPFAVVWIKKSTELIVGLALPATSIPPEFSGPPAGCKYARLTGYFKVTATSLLPVELPQLAKIAYQHTKNAK